MSYVVPVPKALALISSLQGKRTNPLTGQSNTSHGGMDIAVGSGTEVFATANGKVRSSAFEDKGGNFIIIDHDDGKASAYLHLSERLVVTGQRVAAGQLIALSGNTGSSTTGAHLHFEVRKPAKPSDIRLDPLDFLPGNFVLTSSLANQIGVKTVSGKADVGLVGVLLVAGAAYGGWRYLGRSPRRNPGRPVRRRKRARR